MSQINLLLYITFSNGDTLSCIPLIEKIKIKYPDVNLVFCCFSSHKYLIEHLDLPIITLDCDYTYYKHFPDFTQSRILEICPKDLIPINLWCGTYNFGHSWSNQIKVFNMQCKEKNLDLFLDEEDFGYINLPNLDLDVRENAVYIENGINLSNQSDFNFNIYKLSIMFPRVNFYLTSSTPYKSKNIFSSENKNLIYLANLSKKCKMIIGKGSGPFFCTLNYDNKDKIKALFGLKEEWTKDNFKFWEPKNDKILLRYTEQELYELLRMIPKI